MPRGKSAKTKSTDSTPSYLDKIGMDVQSNQSRLSLVLGALIILVIGVLVFNYFNKGNSAVGPSSQTSQEEGDVSPDNLPGKYSVKEGDTLFTIAEKYYQDGYKYTEIAKTNELADVNSLEVGQKLEIPKLPEAKSDLAETSPTPTETPLPSFTPAMIPTNPVPAGEKGASIPPASSFGPAITSDKYTVIEGDWLSTIAARAYNGNILAYQKLAEANKITNPDLIYPGQTLTIPR